jgi:hypothetical protein
MTIHAQGDAAVLAGVGFASRVGALHNGRTDRDVMVLTGFTLVLLGTGERKEPDSARAIHAVSQF